MFRFLTAGESHGKGLTVIVEAVPAGLPIDEAFIAEQLARRQHGHGRGGRMKIEQDRAEITAGVRHGLTLGSPIALWIQNRDWVNWQTIMSAAPVEDEVKTITRLRPGHADFAGAVKYGHSDIRNILERASARETAARVAVGAVARRLLEEVGVEVRSHSVAIGPVEIPEATLAAIDWSRVEDSPVRCADAETEGRMVAAIDQAKEAGDTYGGILEVVALGVPIGLGSHVHWDRKLDGRIGQAMLSIHAAKGVEIGDAFAGARLPGSQVHDVMVPREASSSPFPSGKGARGLGPGEGRGQTPFARLSNRAGGTEGGITNGEPLRVRVAMKPISTLAKPLPSVDLKTGRTVPAHYERSDVCVVPAAGVVAEAMLCIVLADAVLEKFGGDSLAELLRNYEGYLGGVADFIGNNG